MVVFYILERKVENYKTVPPFMTTCDRIEIQSLYVLGTFLGKTWINEIIV
jgi:hypothetical protein